MPHTARSFRIGGYHCQLHSTPCSAPKCSRRRETIWNISQPVTRNAFFSSVPNGNRPRTALQPFCGAHARSGLGVEVRRSAERGNGWTVVRSSSRPAGCVDCLRRAHSNGATCCARTWDPPRGPPTTIGVARTERAMRWIRATPLPTVRRTGAHGRWMRRAAAATAPWPIITGPSPSTQTARFAPRYHHARSWCLTASSR